MKPTSPTATGSGDNDGGAISSSFTLISALSACFPFPFRVALTFPLGALEELSARLCAELEREIEGVSESTAIARGSESGIDCVDDSATIPSEAGASEGEGTAVILRAEAR